jgi:uncharacterized protein
VGNTQCNGALRGRGSSVDLRELIDQTAWIDTHEHLVEEANRLNPDGYAFRDANDRNEWYVPSDWTALLFNYSLDDLVSAGPTPARAVALLRDELEPLAKWRLAEPYIRRARGTGYLRAIDEATAQLFGLRLSADTVVEIDEGLRGLREAGYYRRLLQETANVERCQVNSDECDPFCLTASPDILDQDLSILNLSRAYSPDSERLSGIDVNSVADFESVIDWCFERFAGAAVAVKCQWAYYRPIGCAVAGARPNRAFVRVRSDDATREERREVEDYLFAYCLDRAVDTQLPVKLHLGYLAGTRERMLPGVASHVMDAIALAQSRPRNTFVLMHAAWPQQEQLLAAAKHCPNVVVDLCWAWIVAPLATRDFLCRFLSTVPASKILCFGGDYHVAELIVGHAEIARRGLQAALEELVSCGWFTLDAALELVAPLMRDNALELFYAGPGSPRPIPDGYRVAA